MFSRRLLAADLMNTTEWDESEGHAYRVASGYRPPYPSHMPQPIRELVNDCWSGVSNLRPPIREVVRRLREMQAAGVADDMDAAQAAGGGGCCVVM